MKLNMSGYRSVLEITVCIYLFLQRTTSVYSDVEGQAPNFDVPVINVTATAKRTAILPCTINYVGKHKVLWMDPRGKVLTMNDVRVINDQRISIERPFTKDWNLHIREVQKSDGGEYLCQINTTPAKSKAIILVVTEPPNIFEDAGDQLVREGDTVILWCNATGVPFPNITWYRKNMNDHHTAREAYRRRKYVVNVNDEQDDSAHDGTVIGSEGYLLKIHNISRYCEDEYECVAENGINPAAVRTMKVKVQFPPEVELLTNRISQYKGRETILDCRITANPFGYIVWKKSGREITNGIQIYEDDAYTKTLSLRIGNLDDRDFGKYKCFAMNEFGSDEEDMLLHEMIDRTQRITTTTTTQRTVFNPIIFNTERPRDYPSKKTPTYLYGASRETSDSSASRPVTISAMSTLVSLLTLVLPRYDV